MKISDPHRRARFTAIKIADGTPQRVVRDDPRVVAAYLGRRKVTRFAHVEAEVGL